MADATDAPEVIDVEKTSVACDGGGGALGHPMVYLAIGPKGWVECPYCDRRFVLKGGAKSGGGH
ncbi:MAG: zinc-finger domain-containing protein [Alphaproteobacteria bacterium]